MGRRSSTAVSSIELSDQARYLPQTVPVAVFVENFLELGGENEVDEDDRDEQGNVVAYRVAIRH